MARPSTRQELVDYCLRALGEPVLEVNVDPDQIEDRVDETFTYFMEYHMDSFVRRYIKHQLTAEEVQQGYISLGDDLIQVLRVMPIGNTFNSSSGLFDASYQMMFDAINRGVNLAGDMAYYEQLQQHLSLLDMKLNGSVQFAWSRYADKLTFFGERDSKGINEGDYVLIECYRYVDPDGTNTNTTVYNNIFIKEYLTALIKRQWGQNLIKFEGMQLPGGVTLNGRQLFDDAQQDIERLQERLRLEFEQPVDFFVG